MTLFPRRGKRLCATHSMQTLFQLFPRKEHAKECSQLRFLDTEFM